MRWCSHHRNKFVSKKNHPSNGYSQNFSHFYRVVSLLHSIEANNFCYFKKMEKNEYRAVIKHFHMKGKTPKEIKTELDEVHGTSAPSFKTVYNWVNEFKRGRISTSDAERPGRPIEATTPEMMDKIHDVVLADRRVKVRELAETAGISHGSVITILQEKLAMKKLSADGCRVC